MCFLLKIWNLICLALVNCVTKDLEFVLKQMHAMSSIHLQIKSFTLKKGMKMCMSFILMKLCLIMDHAWLLNDVNDSWLWHRRLGHASMKTLSKLVKNDLLLGFLSWALIRIKFVMHVNLENKLEILLNQKTWSPLLGLLNCCMLTCLDLWMFWAWVASPTDLSSLMIILGSLGFTFLHTKMKHCIHSLDIARKFKMKKASLL